MPTKALFALLTLFVSTSIALSAPPRPPEADIREDVKDAFRNPKEVPGKPRVLIIGDSISIGYTAFVRKKLADQALVFRPSVNCQFTGYGLQNLEKWLGTGKWDVIHFNWGIWDTHYLDAKGNPIRDESKLTGPQNLRYTPAQYHENLEKLVKILEGTGAKLIWASTTPVMTRTGKRFEDIPNLNKEAAEIMKAHHIPTDDLYSFVLPHATEWQIADKVHFNHVGNEQLSDRVTASIQEALAKKQK